MSIFKSRNPDRSVFETGCNLSAQGEPFVWSMAGGLIIGILMIVAFIGLILWNGGIAFFPGPVRVLHLKNGRILAGEPVRSETYRIARSQIDQLPEELRQKIVARKGYSHRWLYKTGNFDLYNDDYRWVDDDEVVRMETPGDMVMVERLEWGPFVGKIQSLQLGQVQIGTEAEIFGRIGAEIRAAAGRLQGIRTIERDRIGDINHRMEAARLALRKVTIKAGQAPSELEAAEARYNAVMAGLQKTYDALEKEVDARKAEDGRYRIVLADVEGRTKEMAISQIVRLYRPNALSLAGKLGIYFQRWWELLSAEPREANTEGGIFPAIFGTLVMTLLMVVVVAPFGVMAALYLREYAKQGALVSAVRICVNNLAGVPSIVYGVFGLGFFAYTVGGFVDRLLFPERLPNPTFGTGGLLWSALTLALLTVPVVIVATEEALSAVPDSLREGSLACGASRWQTIKYVVLPKAMPGILTGLILAMARGAGEVAPLMLVGVVKLAPALPIDGHFPYLHLERSFMHLAFHIFDVGFQSRNSEAGKPMVFVTTLILVGMIAILNATAIFVRNRLKRKYMTGHF